MKLDEFNFVTFVSAELDKLKRLLDDAPRAHAKLAAITAVVKFYESSGREVRPSRGESGEGGRARRLESGKANLNVRRSAEELETDEEEED